MRLKHEDQTANWFAYTVAVTLGIAFSILLFWLAWSTALDDKRRDFSLQSMTLKDSVNHNLRIVHDEVISIAAFLRANPEITRQQFESIIHTLFEQHPFLQGAIYSPLISPENPGPTDPVTADPVAEQTEIEDTISFPVRFNVATRGEVLLYPNQYDLNSDSAFTSVIETIMDTESVVATAIDKGTEIPGRYWLFEALRNMNASENGEPMSREDIQGLIGIQIDTKKLGAAMPNADLSLTMYNDFLRLSSRQVLFVKEAVIQPSGSWSIDSLDDEGVTQFAKYSLKLSIHKDLRWQDIEKAGIYIALIIGFG